MAKREEYIGWADCFMAVARVVAMRSKDPETQVGACIVNKKNRIVATGYNGMPNGCADDSMPWGKEGPDSIKDKHLYVCHAEMNAVLNKNLADVEDCTMYTTLFPCNECTKVIIQSGIKEVVYLSDSKAEKQGTKAAKIMMEKAKVQLRLFEPERSKISIDFTVMDK